MQIKSVQIVGVQTFAIGQVVKGKKIGKIVNSGYEFSESVHSQYDIISEGGMLMYTIENCPVVVEYFSENEK